MIDTVNCNNNTQVTGVNKIASMVHTRHLEKVLGMIEQAKSEGATCVLDGTQIAPEGRGFYVGPTIFDNVTRDMQIWREEVFGPVLAITTFDTEDDAILLANDSKYGLAAGVWTSDNVKAERVAGAIEAGTVYVNHYRSVDPASPIGGVKLSGYGRELGPDAIKDYCQVKSIWTGTAPVPDPFP